MVQTCTDVKNGCVKTSKRVQTSKMNVYGRTQTNANSDVLAQLAFHMVPLSYAWDTLAAKRQDAQRHDWLRSATTEQKLFTPDAHFSAPVTKPFSYSELSFFSDMVGAQGRCVPLGKSGSCPGPRPPGGPRPIYKKS